MVPQTWVRPQERMNFTIESYQYNRGGDTPYSTHLTSLLSPSPEPQLTQTSSRNLWYRPWEEPIFPLAKRDMAHSTRIALRCLWSIAPSRRPHNSNGWAPKGNMWTNVMKYMALFNLNWHRPLLKDTESMSSNIRALHSIECLHVLVSASHLG